MELIRQNAPRILRQVAHPGHTGLEFIQRQRVAVQIALIEPAAICRQEVPLRLCFNALGDHVKAQ